METYDLITKTTLDLDKSSIRKCWENYPEDNKAHIFDVPLNSIGDLLYNAGYYSSNDGPAMWCESNLWEENSSFYGDYSTDQYKEDLLKGVLVETPQKVRELIDEFSCSAQNVGFQKRRHRRNGDYGELNVKRYIDGAGDRLFTYRKRERRPAPIINLCLPIGAPSWCTIYTFEQFAIVATALAQILEAGGYSVNLYFLSMSRVNRNNNVSSRFPLIIKIPLKKAGTPTNFSQVWSFIRPEISRRTKICLIFKLLDALKYTTDKNECAGASPLSKTAAEGYQEICEKLFPNETSIAVPLMDLYINDIDEKAIIAGCLEKLKSMGA